MTCREQLLKQLHETPLYGHRGAAALYTLLNRRFWWPNCHKDCVQYARSCESCQRNNPTVQKPYGLLQALPAPESSFRHLTLDFVGPLPICKIRDYIYRFILQVVDRLTKRDWVIAIERPTARETAESFPNNVVRFSGLPDSLVSDQGRAFIDTKWKEICATLQIIHKLSRRTIQRPTDKLKELIKPWKYICVIMLTITKMIGLDTHLWLNFAVIIM